MMKFDDKYFLAKKIKYHRKKLNLTQAELAEMVNLSDPHISKIENGCYIPSLKSFFMLVDVLNIDLREFGYNNISSDNPAKDRLIELINNASERELIFYKNILFATSQSLTEAKTNK